MTIWFDMDGTFVDLYSVENWLPKLRAEDPTPYEIALPLVNTKEFEKLLAALQHSGTKIGILSWGAKNSTPTYFRAVSRAKRNWLKSNLPAIKWDKICILPHGTSKNSVGAAEDILIDDEEQNRNQWKGRAFLPSQIFQLIKFS